MTTPQDLDLLDPRLKLLCHAILGAARVPGASVALVAGDRKYHLAYGVKSVRTNEPVTADTSFNIGSCSKAFVSATVASLVAEGRVQWDDPVTQWVPELELYDAQITQRVTLRDLSANRLGLPRVGLTESGFDPSFPSEHIFARLKYTQPVFAFRERFGYVNAGAIVNSVAVGRITGQGFLATLRERILAPLGMSGTSGGAAAQSELSDQAGWHVLINDSPVAIDPIFTDQYLASGGMVVSGRDALQWLRLHLNGGLVDGQQVVPREALLETHRPHSVATPGKDIVSLFYPGAYMAAYALGWGVSDLEGHPLVMHPGGDFGVSATTLLLPKAGIGIAVYCNSNCGTPVPLAHALAATLLGLKPRDWVGYFESFTPPEPAVAEPAAAAPAARDLQLYAGTYEHPADGPLDLQYDGERLSGNLRHAYRMAFTLEPTAEHAFALRFIHPEMHSASAAQQPTLSFSVEDGCATRAEISGPFQGRAFLRTSQAS